MSMKQFYSRFGSFLIRCILDSFVPRHAPFPGIQYGHKISGTQASIVIPVSHVRTDNGPFFLSLRDRIPFSGIYRFFGRDRSSVWRGKQLLQTRVRKKMRQSFPISRTFTEAWGRKSSRAAKVLLWKVVAFLYRAYFFQCRPLPPFPPTSWKRDAAYDYLKYRITVKGGST